MNLDEATDQSDREELSQYMRKELEDRINRKYWKVIPSKSLRKVQVPIPMAWSMRIKINQIGEIKKWKEILCAGGHR